jgi:hypothetical protein
MEQTTTEDSINTKPKDHIEDIEEEDEDDHVFNEKLQCRFYRKDFPEENDLVMVIKHSIHIIIQILIYPFITWIDNFLIDSNY